MSQQKLKQGRFWLAEESQGIMQVPKHLYDLMNDLKTPNIQGKLKVLSENNAILSFPLEVLGKRGYPEDYKIETSISRKNDIIFSTNHDGQEPEFNKLLKIKCRVFNEKQVV